MTPELALPTDPGQVRLGVIVGHNAEKRGASLPNGMTEWEYNREVAKRIKYLSVTKYFAIDVVIIYRGENDGPMEIPNVYKRAEMMNCDAVIELHFNAFNKKVEGTETLCTFMQDDIEFAEIIHNKTCNTFYRDGNSRGVKRISRSSRGGVNVHSFPLGVNCLVEPFFGDNPDDANMAMANGTIDAYAEALLSGVYLWAVRKMIIEPQRHAAIT